MKKTCTKPKVVALSELPHALRRKEKSYMMRVTEGEIRAILDNSQPELTGHMDDAPARHTWNMTVIAFANYFLGRDPKFKYEEFCRRCGFTEQEMSIFFPLEHYKP